MAQILAQVHLRHCARVRRVVERGLRREGVLLEPRQQVLAKAADDRRLA